MAAAERVGRALTWSEKGVATEYEGLISERAAFLKKPAVPAVAFKG
jgi:hypothetical protein